MRGELRRAAAIGYRLSAIGGQLSRIALWLSRPGGSKSADARRMRFHWQLTTDY